MSKRACVLLAASALAVSGLANTASAVVLFNNGGFVTNPTGGTGTIAGQPISQIELPSTTFGAGHNEAAAVRLADDFTVGAPGWDLSTATVYGYLTGATTPMVTSVRLELFDNPPGAGGNSLGVQTLPVTLGTGTLIAYRQTSTGTSDSTRRVFAYTVSMDGFAGGGQLGPGTYWLALSVVGNSFVPLVTPRATAPNLNGRQLVTGTWNALDDDPGTPVLGGAVPFYLEGELIPEPASLSLMGLAGVALLARRRA